MPYPGLVQEDHKILGSEYCSGYTDVYSKWNTGFYCPQTGSTSAVFCCGTPYLKYCCTTRPSLEDEEEHETAMLPYTVRIPVFFAIFCGVLAIVFLLITAVCFFCSCCFVYKKRRDEASTGLYRIQGSSSTASALASIYSNHNSSVVTTPLDTDWTSQLPATSFIPYPLQSYPSSTIMPTLHSNNTSHNNITTNNNNNNIPAFYYNNLSPHAFTSNNMHLNTNATTNMSNNSNFSSLSSLYQAQYHQSYQRPLSAQSSVSTYSANSNLTLPGLPTQLQQHQRPLNPSGFNNLSRNQGYVYRPQVQNALPNSMNSFLNPFCFPNNTSGTNGQLPQNRFNQNGRPRQFQQQQPTAGYQSQALPYNNNNTAATTARPRTPGNQLNQEQQERLATVQSLISAYRASVNSATAAVMRSHPGSFNNRDVNRLNEINLLFSAVLNQNRRPGSGGGGFGSGANANGVIRTSGESQPATTTTTTTTTTNMNNTNTARGNDGVISNCANVGITSNSSLKETRSTLVCPDANGNSNSRDDRVTSVPLSIDDNDTKRAEELVPQEPSPGQPEDPGVTITIAEGEEEKESLKQVTIPVLPQEEPPPASNCVDISEIQTTEKNGEDGENNFSPKKMENICFDKGSLTKLENSNPDNTVEQVTKNQKA